MSTVKMLDGRALAKQGEVATMDQQCFAFHHAPSMVKNWEDPQEVLKIYFPEVEAIVRKSVPGAEHPDAKVLVFDHALRTGGTNLKEAVTGQPTAGWGPYGALVHSDNTHRSMHARVKDWILGTTEVAEKYGGYPSGWADIRPSHEWQKSLFRAETADHSSPEGYGGEHLIVNVWRPLSVVKQWGLAVLDGRSLAPGDVHPTVRQNMSASGLGAAFRGVGGQVVDLEGVPINERFNELLTPLHSSDHRWVYYPDMTPDEALVFKINDSRNDGRPRSSCHTAFKDPRGEPGAHRSSIEVRTLVILPPSAGNQSKL